MKQISFLSADLSRRAVEGRRAAPGVPDTPGVGVGGVEAPVLEPSALRKRQEYLRDSLYLAGSLLASLLDVWALWAVFWFY